MEEYAVTFFWANGTKCTVKVFANSKDEAIERGIKYPFIAPNGNYNQSRKPAVRKTMNAYIN